MPVNRIINAAPLVIQRGTRDLSSVPLIPDPVNLPQHLPLIHFFGERGETNGKAVTSDEFLRNYGKRTVDPRDKYYNHSTLLGETAMANGNMIYAKRLIPDDAGPRATLILWLDVLETDVPRYKRDSSGQYLLDADGNKQVLDTVSGHKLKWVVTHANSHEEANDINSLASKEGTMSGTGGSTSTMHPWFAFTVSTQGEHGNLAGLRIWAPNDLYDNVPEALMLNQKMYQFQLQLVRRPSLQENPVVIETRLAEQAIDFGLKPGVIDSSTDAQQYLGDIFMDSYSNKTDKRYGLDEGEFGELFIFQEHIDAVLEAICTKELAYTTEWSDIDPEGTAKDEMYLINPFSGVSSAGVPYTTVVMDSGSVSMDRRVSMYAGGASDGTMDNDMFEKLLLEDIREYADENSPKQSVILHPENWLYDAGYSLDTVLELNSFIALRKDTVLITGLYTVDGEERDVSEEISAAAAIRTRLRLTPESHYWGTPTSRAAIFGGSGVLRNHQYKKRVPMTVEIINKVSRYMGAANGKWVEGKAFDGSNRDGAPGHLVELLTDLSRQWTPAKVRNRLWDVCINFTSPYGQHSDFFPSWKTVYDDDTSVLNSIITVAAIADVQRIMLKPWRELAGSARFTPAQITERTNTIITKNTAGKYDNRFNIIPKAMFTEADRRRGYSGTLPVKFEADPMFEVFTTYVEAYRKPEWGSAYGLNDA